MLLGRLRPKAVTFFFLFFPEEFLNVRSFDSSQSQFGLKDSHVSN